MNVLFAVVPTVISTDSNSFVAIVDMPGAHTVPVPPVWIRRKTDTAGNFLPCLSSVCVLMLFCLDLLPLHHN